MRVSDAKPPVVYGGIITSRKWVHIFCSCNYCDGLKAFWQKMNALPGSAIPVKMANSSFCCVANGNDVSQIWLEGVAIFRSFLHPLIHPLIHQSVFRPSVHLSIDVCIHPHVRPLMHSFVFVFVPSFVHSLSHAFFYLGFSGVASSQKTTREMF